MHCQVVSWTLPLVVECRATRLVHSGATGPDNFTVVRPSARLLPICGGHLCVRPLAGHRPLPTARRHAALAQLSCLSGLLPSGLILARVECVYRKGGDFWGSWSLIVRAHSTHSITHPPTCSPSRPPSPNMIHHFRLCLSLFQSLSVSSCV